MNLTPRRLRRQQEDQEGGNRTFEDDVIPLNNFLSMMAEKKFFLANASPRQSGLDTHSTICTFHSSLVSKF